MSHPERSIGREMKPLAELTKPEQKQIHELDAKADLIQLKRARMAELLRQVRQTLPKEMSLHDLAQLPIEEAFSKLNFSTGEKRLHRRAMVELKQLLELQRDLEQSGGLKPSADAQPAEREAYDFYKARFGDLAFAAKKIDDDQNHINELLAEYDDLVKNPRRSGEAFDTQTHALTIAEIRKEASDLEKQLNEYILSSPEAYLAMNLLTLTEMKDHFDANGRIVETPYVKQMKARVRSILSQGRAVFVHGELGAGKTEFAKDLARDIWLEKHPAPPLPVELQTESDPTVRNQMRKEWALKMEEWKALRDAQWEAPIIYGRKGIETDEIFGARKIQRAESISPEEQVRRIESGWKTLQEQLAEENAGGYDEDALRETYHKAMLESFRAPVETANFLGPLMHAMKNGRVLIIDELNAIPHHVLIAMNDMLLKRPGETVLPPISGEPPIIVKAGFAVIATGNFKPEDGKIYVGRQQLDAAFLSRFGVVNYDYLPNPTNAAPDKADVERLREYRHQSEQTTMFALRLLNKDCSMSIPESAFGPQGHIERLARVARQIQDIFSAPEGTKFYRQLGDTRVDMKTSLKENVLSIRHVIPIIESWRNEGFSHDFNEYLFLNYVVNSSARPTEMLLIYAELQVQGGFFPTDKGWPNATDPDASTKILDYAIQDKLFPINPKTKQRTLASVGTSTEPIRQFHAREVVEWLAGPIPERTAVSKQFVDRASRIAQAKTEHERRLEQAERLKCVKSVMDMYENPDIFEHLKGLMVE